MTTKEWDQDADIYYFNLRWSSSTIGRFLEVAPFPPYIEHPYSFAANNPVHCFDPTGEIIIDLPGGEGGQYELEIPGFPRVEIYTGKDNLNERLGKKRGRECAGQENKGPGGPKDLYGPCKEYTCDQYIKSCCDSCCKMKEPTNPVAQRECYNRCTAVSNDK